MDLLFRRAQTSGDLSRVKFTLWGKVELDEEEQALIKRYDFDRAVLIEVYQPELIRRGVYVAIGVFALLLGVFGSMLGISMGTFMGMALAAFAGWLYVDRHRETIFVRDLLHGRNFKCDSVVDLARKEAWLTTVVSFLRQVMVSAKHWDGTERHAIEPLPKDEARQVILRGI